MFDDVGKRTTPFFCTNQLVSKSFINILHLHVYADIWADAPSGNHNRPYITGLVDLA